MKARHVIFNIFWVILFGLWEAIYNIIWGVVCCITIIGIPFGLQYFKYNKLVFAPAGKRVVLKYSKHPIMNTLWILFGGGITYLTFGVFVLVFGITIIGIPIAKQIVKLARFYLAPFGAEIVGEDEFTQTMDATSDVREMVARITDYPDRELVGFNGQAHVTARDYIKNRFKDILLVAKESKRPNILGVIFNYLLIFLLVLSVIVLEICGLYLFMDFGDWGLLDGVFTSLDSVLASNYGVQLGDFGLRLISFIVITVPLITLVGIWVISPQTGVIDETSSMNKPYAEIFAPLMPYYPESAKKGKKFNDSMMPIYEIVIKRFKLYKEFDVVMEEFRKEEMLKIEQEKLAKQQKKVVNIEKQEEKNND